MLFFRRMVLLLDSVTMLNDLGMTTSGGEILRDNESKYRSALTMAYRVHKEPVVQHAGYVNLDDMDDPLLSPPAM